MGGKQQATASRREVLKGVAVGTPLALSGFSVPGSVAGSAPTGSDLLGDFGEGTDGWRARGPNRERRIEAGDASVIETGDHGLQVPFSDARLGRVRNDKRVRKADFTGGKHLTARVAGSAMGTDSPIVFFARLHYAGRGRGHRPGGGDAPQNGPGKTGGDPSAGGRGADGNGQNPGVDGGRPVIQSGPVVVPQNRPHWLYWDLSDQPKDKLARARRVEILWFLAGYPPAEDGEERGHGNSSLHGSVLFDNVQLMVDDQRVDELAFDDAWEDLRARHGAVVETDIEVERPDLTHGIFQFSDGSEVPFAVILHEDPDELPDGQSPLVTHVLEDKRYTFRGVQP